MGVQSSPVERALEELRRRGTVSRVTFVWVPSGTEDNWTAMVRVGENVSSIGHGDSQEGALYEALEGLGSLTG